MAAKSEQRKVKHSNDNGLSSFIFVLSVIVALMFLGLSSLHYYPAVALRYFQQLTHPYNSSGTATVRLLPNGDTEHPLIVVTDLDHDSRLKDGKLWQSLLMEGVLRTNQDRSMMQITWEPKEHSLRSQFAAGNRAMELSDLVRYDGNVLTVDDRTGIIYKIEGNQVIPWVFLNDGPGNTTKGFKAEWMAVKNELLYIGGLGKEWTTPQGVFVSHDPMYVKVVTPRGEVQHLNWVENYKALRRAADIEYPGYMIFESAQWSEIHQRWFFLPRRVSNQTYSETLDEFQGSNLMLIADEDFKNIEVREVGDSVGDGSRGFSAFQFLPGSDDAVIVALKSQERDGVAVATFITAFGVRTGRSILDETPISGEPYKFEGLLFL